jgi:hypothetical protein
MPLVPSCTREMARYRGGRMASRQAIGRVRGLAPGAEPHGISVHHGRARVPGLSDRQISANGINAQDGLVNDGGAPALATDPTSSRAVGGVSAVGGDPWAVASGVSTRKARAVGHSRGGEAPTTVMPKIRGRSAVSC